jgi:hypothetical protein
MTSDRDILEDLLLAARIDAKTPDETADDIERAGWRPPAQVITDVEELNKLPNWTVILDANEEFHRLNPYGMDDSRTWFPAWLTGNAYATDFGQDPELPATVVYLPTENGGTGA